MIYIVVEGQTDKALVKNILSDKKEQQDYKFLGLKGDGSVFKVLKNLRENDFSQNSYFAIVDADKSFTKRDAELAKFMKEDNYYIFPNHKDNGDLETLLLSSISENKIIKCFDKYKKCVEKDIDNKAKFYAYTTLEHNQKPEEYIETLDTSVSDFTKLKQKLQNLFN